MAKVLLENSRPPLRVVWARQADERARADWLILLGIVALGVVLRRPWTHLHAPFWLDEAWVADSVRAPLSRIATVTGPTPILFTLALRLVPHGALRLLPIAFGAAAAIPAWFIGRSLEGRLGRIAAPLAAAVAALAPPALARVMLKQYASDTLVALLCVVAVIVLEKKWSTKRLVAYAIASVPLVLFSNTAAFVIAACAIALLIDKEHRRFTAIVAGATGIVQLAFAKVLILPHHTSALHHEWQKQSAFIPLSKGPIRAAIYTVHHLLYALGRTGFGPAGLGLVLAAIGAGTLYRKGYKAAALVLPLTTLVLIAAGALQVFPFLEERTSLFFFVMLAVYAGIGVAGVVSVMATKGRLVTVATAIIALALFAPAARAGMRAPAGDSTVTVTWTENIDQQARYINNHLQPGDVVVTSYFETWGFAYYWPGAVTFAKATGPGAVVPFNPSYPNDPEILSTVVTGPKALQATLDRVPRDARRIWLVVSHVVPSESEVLVRFAHERGVLSTPFPGLGPILVTAHR